MALQRARVIGGCSAHNGAAAVWGHSSDYDAWAVENPGWSAAEVAPLFREVDAKLRVYIPARADLTPFHDAVLEAAAQAGYPFIADLRSLEPEHGFAIGPVNIDPATRVRWNAAFAYLDPVRGLPNLRVVGDTLVDTLTLDGNRVTGVDVVGLRRREAHCRRAGDSGRRRLRLAARAAALRHWPGGRAARFRDRAAPRPARRGAQPAGPPRHRRPLSRRGQRRSRRWRTSSPPVACRGRKGQSGWRAPAAAPGPYDLHIYPIASHPLGSKGWRFHISAALMAPRSRGAIRLNPDRPRDPEAPPVIDTGFFTDAGGDDLDALREALALCRALGAQPALASLLEEESTPETTITGRAALREWIRGHAGHDYHPAGTCRMGPAGDATAVVDASGNVHGVGGVAGGRRGDHALRHPGQHQPAHLRRRGEDRAGLDEQVAS